MKYFILDINPMTLVSGDLYILTNWGRGTFV